jgi:hypothetical protein
VHNTAKARAKAFSDNVPLAGAPAGAVAGSPGLVVPFAPAPAGPPILPVAPGGLAASDYPPIEEESSMGPPEVSVEAPEVPVEAPEVPVEAPEVPGVPGGF